MASPMIGMPSTAAPATDGPAVSVAKVFGNAVPESFRQGEAASQMTPASPFGPGQPIGPYDGYDRMPRTRDFVTGYNIATRPRVHERVSFDTLKGLIRAYDVADICCVPGTEIITKRGLIPIEDVVAGDEVITHLGRWRRVTRTMVNQPHEPVRTLKTSAFEDLSVTGNHPVWAVDYGLTQANRRFAKGIGWTSADKLRPRGPKSPGSRRFDGLVLPALAFPDGRPVLDVAAILGADYTVGPDGRLALTRGGRLTGVPAKVAMDATLGRLLGWYMAEGSQGHGRDVNFTLGAGEGNYAEQILADAEAIFGLKGTVRPVSAGASIGVLIHSTILGSLFSCGRAKTKRLPDWAWGGGREFFAALLEAWALGDGCRSVRSDTESPRIMVATSSRDLAWQMRMVAIALGISACVVTLRNRDKYDAVIRGQRIATSPVQYHVTWREKPARWGRESFEFDGRWLATALVSAGQSDYDGPVYNLEVDEDESYVTTGGTVHNCIWHRIDSIRSLQWKLLPADHVTSDVTGAVPLGVSVLRKPDGKRFFKTWLASYLYDILAYDSGALVRMRNRGGRCVGLKTFDGTSLAPLLDYWGDPPDPPAEAYVQFANGLPWNWLTRDDVIYEPFRPHNDSPYGHAPIESIILNANTDMRFQLYFLERFTSGNLPAAFAAAPETWGPDQIEQFQAYWDAMMYGDQAGKHQIKWMPPGSKFEWSNEKDFSDQFSLFMMRKTCASYSVVPSDLGFTADVNRSSGESQADVQHRVGDLPLMEHVEGILSQFIYDDLGLPLKFEFDRGEEQVDQLAQAQADQAYMDRAVVSPSEIREMRYGLTDAKPVPRVFFTARGGPIPLNSLEGLAGQIDPQTAAPVPGAPLPHAAFTDVEGVISNPPLMGEPLAEQEYGPSAIPAGSEPVAKEGEAAPGITAGTGIYGYDGPGEDDEPKVITPDYVTAGEPDPAAQVAKELAAFKNFRRKRRSAGEWHDFGFRAVDPIRAHNLNDDGRLAVRKAAGEIAVAGLAVLAADTGRVLMLQRALCAGDPAAGKLEFPGGHLDGEESPLAAAWREFCEETGVAAPPGVQTGSWVSPDGIYQGIVWTAESEVSVPVRGEAFIPNPDDPDGDAVEAILWMNPADLPGNPMLRAELAADLDAVLAALGCNEGASEGDESTCPCGTPAVFDEMNGWQHGDGSISHDDGESVSDKMGAVLKADDSDPKGRKRHWPGWDLDLKAVEHWAPLLAAALSAALSQSQAEQIARAYIAEHPAGEDAPKGKREAVEAATVWLAGQGVDLIPAIKPLVPGILSDAHLIGGASAAAMTDGGNADLGGWQPGDTGTAQQRTEDLGLAAILSSALALAGETAQRLASGYLTKLGRALVDGMADGLSAADIAASMLAILSDPADPNGSLLTTIVAGMGASALAWYLNQQVQMGFWQSADDGLVCATCQMNEDAGPLPMGDTYPSGDDSPPAHGRCRCALVPA